MGEKRRRGRGSLYGDRMVRPPQPPKLLRLRDLGKNFATCNKLLLPTTDRGKHSEISRPRLTYAGRMMVNVRLATTSLHGRADSTCLNTIWLNGQETAFIGLSKAGVKVSPHFFRGTMDSLGT